MVLLELNGLEALKNWAGLNSINHTFTECWAVCHFTETKFFQIAQTAKWFQATFQNIVLGNTRWSSVILDFIF